ncbi:acyltransferase [Rhizobium sp. Leaf341]|uniref:acyltransferase n=1 Tax=Rhizobium sp. Leaf341 TaxID=1736344 RepID=UPI00071381D7|nr:acyltransferase [Rhizobium sp. Leaf341]KQR75785.1 hypothetical protein ASG03_19140 [Rhizobium sp. Leaf341]
MTALSAEARLSGIDACRVVAFVFIVALHAKSPFLPPRYGLPLEILPRFAVPFFFLVSGYFLKVDTPKFSAFVGKFVQRLLAIYIVWMLVYLVAWRLFHVDFGFATIVGLVVGGGPGYHLWFLPSLGVSVITVFGIARFFGDRALVAICLLLYGIGLYYVALSAPLGPAVHWNFRNGPFFGALFVALGFLIRKHGWQPGMRGALTLTTLGLLLSGVERAVLVLADLATPSQAIDYTLGTVPFGVGVFAIALNLSPRGRMVGNLAALGRYTLGLYCIHVLHLWWVQWLLPATSLGNVLIATAVTVSASVATILLLSRVTAFRRFIR